ncbi:tripartite tricarboxylate transporter substrate binding protein [Pseudolabrys taiwanensis]|uniref:Tripartite tricarboxylate transporter substrate binding protein n=1 Tax=Pseudolabrys taiwanensis TaxID=331696 RepID=A0A345ZQ98_9HYPH|nr:tripartite tricarboxylate transporter substrate binding protein [Pseudolabrys taiwanensis]AXK79095.1 tripartite tricarboxylate transporter substrate binding protein [Pseudolabrys taiwanensis]
MLRRTLLVAASMLVCAATVPAARAEWPERPIRWVVPFGPGGANDLIARVAAEAVRKQLGQTIVIENRPGAGAVVGTAAVAKAAPDGYTFLIGAAGVITNSMLIKNLSYKDEELVPVGMIAVAPSTIVVHPSVPASNMKEFVAWAKAQGEKGVTWATAGSGSTPHFVAEMVKDATGIAMTIVPFRSGNDGVNAVLSNTASATSEASIVVLPQIQAGLLKPIATTYKKRISAYPSLPTTAEQGYPSIEIGHWAGLLAPRGTPQPIIDKMNAAIQAGMKTQEAIDKLSPSGIEPAAGSVADFAAFIDTERKRLGAIAVKAKMGEQ